MAPLKIISTAIVSTLLVACVGTKAGAYKVFAEDLQRLKGAPFSTSGVYWVGHLAQEHPVETKQLSNGNEIRAYKMQKNHECTVLIEVDPKADLIIDASSKGPECWRAY